MESQTEKFLPTPTEIAAAQKRIAGVACITPLIEAPSLSRKFNRQIYLKLECFQPTGAFKIRGAYNKISQLSQGRIIAASSGNHGIAVSYCCHLLQKECTVIVPENAVEEKVSRIRDYGAKVVSFVKYGDQRTAKAREISQQTGGVFLHPYDDPAVIAGQGTCGLEIASQLSECDSVIFPVGGGGLISGGAIALKSKRPATQIIGVEPEGAAKLHEALKVGRPVTLPSPSSIADGLIPQSVCELTLQAAMRYVDATLTVSDDQILEAMGMLIRDAHVIVEPSGAAPLAALIANLKARQLGERVVLVISGGNVSLDLLSKVLSTSN